MKKIFYDGGGSYGTNLFSFGCPPVLRVPPLVVSHTWGSPVASCLLKKLNLVEREGKKDFKTKEEQQVPYIRKTSS
ncbi:hypothetical protein QJS04_geneDACA000579 [Acorus gramineus]|uniref:Uncharacterized protein n=1 Tax=Acorus gramineus TaxID=55184 RepID=A0AAV9AQ99_ACOGR|nr:hypothetical protein QJS04_geneDACA000579 [Acorus gramineus]